MLKSIANQSEPAGKIMAQTSSVPVQSSPRFRAAGDSSLERNPQQDSYEKENNHTAAKVTVGALGALGLAVAADYIFAKGKHVKKIFGKAESEASKGADDAAKKAEEEAAKKAAEEAKKKEEAEKQLEEEVKALFDAEEKAKQEARQAIVESDRRNELWLQEQHQIKEKAYLDFWEKELSAKEASFKKETDGAVIDKFRKLQEDHTETLARFSMSKRNIDGEGFYNSIGPIERLSDGTYRMVRESADKSSQSICYSKDGKVLDRIEELQNGKMVRDVEFTDNGRTGELGIYNDSGKLTDVIVFDVELDSGHKFLEWRDYSISLGESGIHRIYRDIGGNIYWEATPPKDSPLYENGFSLGNWIRV